MQNLTQSPQTWQDWANLLSHKEEIAALRDAGIAPDWYAAADAGLLFERVESVLHEARVKKAARSC